MSAKLQKEKQGHNIENVVQAGDSQEGGFTYAGRETVNQAAKVAPGVIKAATNNINKIAKQRINQTISQGEKEIERVLPKILGGALEDIYQTPFRLLSNFGKQQLDKTKRKILN